MPNIFRFAPSELSQDAMFIWLARCATESDAALRRLGNAFVQFLLKAGTGTVFDRNDQPVPYSGSGVVSLLEGGYDLEATAASAAAHLSALLSA